MKKKKIIIYIISILIILELVVIGCFLIISNNQNVYMNHLKLAQKYLLEEDYEQAAAEFKMAITIDPMEVEAYLGLSETYIRQGDYNSALEWLEKGYELTQNEDIQAKINMIESGQIYDSDGKLRKRTGFNANGERRYILEYNYTQGKEDTVTHYDGSGNYVESIKCEYDKEGNAIVDCSGYEESGRLIYGKNIFHNGMIIKKEQYYTDGSYIITYEYEYNSEGKISIVRSDDGNTIKTAKYEYDTRGLKSDIKIYNEANQLIECTTFEYDKDKRLLKQAWYIVNDSQYILSNTYIHKYDEDGNWLGDYSYDRNGNLINYNTP